MQVRRLAIIAANIIFGLFAGLIVFAQTWQGPPAGATPPQQNRPAPVHVGNEAQTKQGVLKATDLEATTGDVKGVRLCIGADCRDAWPQPTQATTYTAGQGIAITNGQINVSGGTCAIGQVLQRNAANNGWQCGTVATATSVNTFQILQNQNGGTGLTIINTDPGSSASRSIILYGPNSGYAAIFARSDTYPTVQSTLQVIMNQGAASKIDFVTNGNNRLSLGANTTGGNVSLPNSDLSFTSGKAIRADAAGASTLNVGNWGGAGGASQPVTLSVLGTGSKITTPELCVGGTSGAACKTSWPSGGIVAEDDPQVGALTVGKWCRTNDTGNGVICDRNAPQWITSGSNVYYSNGNVGIGTDVPAYSLDVVSTNNVLRVGNANSWLKVSTGGNSRVSLGDGAAHEAGYIAGGHNTSGQNIITISGCDDAGNCPSATVFHQSGNVGIGTTTPTARLDINGNMRVGSAGAGYFYLGNRGFYILEDLNGNDLQTNAGNFYVYNGGWTRLLRENDLTAIAPVNIANNRIFLSGVGCSNGQVLKWNGTAFACANDIDTNTSITYTVNNPLALSGTTISLAGNCTNGQVLKSNGGNGWSCQNDIDTDTNSGGTITGVTAGNGLTGGGSNGNVSLYVNPGTGITAGATGVSLASSYADGSVYDGRFVNTGGDTMTGNLTLQGVDLFMTNGKAIRIDAAQDTILNIGNWNNASGTTPTRKASVNIAKGDLLVNGNGIQTTITHSTTGSLIGTQTNHPLDLVVNGTSKVSIGTDGRVSIGSGVKVDSVGNVEIGSSSSPPFASSNPGLYIYGNARIRGDMNVSNFTASGYIVGSNVGTKVYYASKSDRGTTTPIGEESIIALCGDDDGCETTLVMYDWDGSQRSASRTNHFFYNPNNKNWRSDHTDSQGKNLDGVTQHVAKAWACYFTDGIYINWADQGDRYGNFSLLSWNDSGYVAECRLVIRD